MRSLRRVRVLIVSGVLGGILGLAVVGVWALPVVFRGRVLPGVAVRGIALTGDTASEVLAALASLGDGARAPVAFAVPRGAVLAPELREIGGTLDVERTIAAAFAAGRGLGWRGMLERARLLARGTEISPVWRVDQETLVAYLQRGLADDLRDPQEPSWGLTADGAFVFQPGEAGVGLPTGEILAAVNERLASGSVEPVPVRLVERPPTVSEAQARVAGVAVSRVTARPLTLMAPDAEVLVPTSVLESWVRTPPPAGAGAGGAFKDPELDRAAIERYLRETVGEQVARPPRDAQFEVAGERATVFVPSRDGVALASGPSAAGILNGLAQGADRIKLVTAPIPSKVTTTPRMAEYGIRSLVARGETDFAGSPKNRIHNIRVGSEQYHGLLIPPGAEFSFNENLGPVDAANGFLRELVILSNVTTPQYGGGLCQVSTTMFRSAIHAGLPITARKNHAYAVSYYGVPGFDATIYPPNPDLRFVNDTPGHLLIQMKLEATKLAFEFWGTPDGRQVEVLGPFPYDRQASGALKATLVRKVTRAGETRRDEWTSNYKSPKLFPKVLAANAERETWEQQVARIAEKDRKAEEAFERNKAELERRTQEQMSRPQRKPAPTQAPTPKPAPLPE